MTVTIIAKSKTPRIVNLKVAQTADAAQKANETEKMALLRGPHCYKTLAYLFEFRKLEHKFLGIKLE